MKPETLRSLEGEFERFPILRAEAVGDGEIDEAVAALGVEFPPDYRELVRRYGAAMLGSYPVFGLRPVEPMGTMWSVVQVNRHFRKDRWPGVDDWLIVSMDLGGNPIGIAADGQVWISDHGHVSIIASSFEEFVRREGLGLRD